MTEGRRLIEELCARDDGYYEWSLPVELSHEVPTLESIVQQRLKQHSDEVAAHDARLSSSATRLTAASSLSFSGTREDLRTWLVSRGALESPSRFAPRDKLWARSG
jgi:hypothetical protein